MYRLASDLKNCKRLPIGMIGGGAGSFFAPYHRAAMRLSDRWQLAAGVFSSNPEKSMNAGGALGVEEARVYPDAGTLARKERGRADGVKAVAVVTPNHLHFEACHTLL